MSGKAEEDILGELGVVGREALGPNFSAVILDLKSEHILAEVGDTSLGLCWIITVRDLRGKGETKEGRMSREGCTHRKKKKKDAHHPSHLPRNCQWIG